MTTINHECYVSLEVAELLKQAGFDWECRCYYETSGKLRGKNSGSFSNHNSPLIWQNNGNTDTQLYSAPTLDVAQRWLREVKGFEVTIDWSVIVNFKLVDFNGRAYNYHVESDDYADGDNELTSYEHAQEAGIKEALELILEKGE